MFKNLIYIIVVVGVALLLFLSKTGEKTWAAIDPVQCNGNPWEIWQRGKGVAYDLSEEGIIKLYYQEKEGIEVFEVRSEQTHETVCQACSCPRGDTIYLLVDNHDVPVIL